MRKPSKNAADPSTLLNEDRVRFAAKVRAARAVLGWSQGELAKRAELTQRSIHRIEQGTSDIRQSTSFAIATQFASAGIEFKDGPDRGFKLLVHPEALAPKLQPLAQKSPLKERDRQPRRQHR